MQKIKFLLIFILLFVGSVFLFIPESSGTFINSVEYNKVKVENKVLNNRFSFNKDNDYNFTKKQAIDILSKWHSPVYENPELLLTILNCAIKDFVLLNKFDSVKVDELNSILQSKFSHTQKLKMFEKFPGNDPWGTYKGKPVYKKLLPSEMCAMKIYTEKITGKCTSLAFFIYSLIKANYKDLSPDNIFLIRMNNHTCGIVKWNSNIYMFNNNGIKLLKPRQLEEINKRNYFMLFNEDVFFEGAFTFPGEIFSIGKDLKSAFILHNKDLKKVDVNINPKLVELGLQIADFNYIKFFIDASLESEIINVLIQDLEGIEQVLSWVSGNIANNSIFNDSHKRIMTPEQVVMFKQGTSLDRAILFATILKGKNIGGEIIFLNNHIYLRTADKYFDINIMKEIPELSELAEVKIIF